MMNVNNKSNLYYLISTTSLLIAVIGFSYNTWRLQATEENSNIRTASFEVYRHLSELEQVIYAGHYDQNTVEGNPRKGWVNVGVIVDLSSLINLSVEHEAKELHRLWSAKWAMVISDESEVKILITQLENIRTEIKTELHRLN